MPFCFKDKMSAQKLENVKRHYKEHYEKRKNGNHVTTNKYSTKKKKNLLIKLKENKSISFILNHIKVITPKSDVSCLVSSSD